MRKIKPYANIEARESALVTAQCLLQRALNETYCNPRDHEATDPAKTTQLFKYQRIKLAAKLSCSTAKIERFFSDDSKLDIKNFAEALSVLGYDLILDISKRKTDIN